jgi:hypothetical protein
MASNPKMCLQTERHICKWLHEKRVKSTDKIVEKIEKTAQNQRKSTL